MAYRKRITFHEHFKQHFGVVCKKCGSTDVYLDFEQAGGYSEYTQWDASFSCRCGACENEVNNYDDLYEKPNQE